MSGRAHEGGTRVEWVVTTFPADEFERQRRFRDEQKALDYCDENLDDLPILERREITVETTLVRNYAER